jgi:hypothetical protein
MGKTANSLDNKKFQTLLHINDCLNNRIILNVKLYYEIGIVIASSIIIAGVYSVINSVYKLLLIIPILIALGEAFYLYLTFMTMKFEWFLIENVEYEIDELIKSKIFCYNRKLGMFRNIICHNNSALREFSINKWAIYLAAYLFFCGFALLFNFGKIITIPGVNWKIGLFEWSLWFYSCILLGLLIGIRSICNDFNSYSERIKTSKFK